MKTPVFKKGSFFWKPAELKELQLLKEFNELQGKNSSEESGI